MAQDNAALIRKGYDAFIAGDMATLSELFHEDAVWHLPGNGGLAGTKKGRDETFAYFGELVARSNGTLKVTMHDVLANDEHAIGLHNDRAERNGKTIDHNVVLIFHLRDGKIAEAWEFHEDQAANDAFWS
jgi:ketosteroid isomerase-like protein